jgi:hypothetical protein
VPVPPTAGRPGSPEDLVWVLRAAGIRDRRVMVLESADPEIFVAHVDLTKVAEYTAEAAKAGGRRTRRWACCGTSSASYRS